MSTLGPITTAVAAGGAGTASGTVVSDRPVSGIVAAIYLQYNDAPPAATTDVTIKTIGASGVLPSITLLALTNGASDGYYVPQAPVYTAAGAATGTYTPFVVNDYIQVDMAQANNGDSVSVWLELV